MLISYNVAKTDSSELESLRQILNYWRAYKTDSTIFYYRLLIDKALSCDEVSKAYKGYELGIKKEDHHRLFKKFSQLDQPNESHMGSTGFGLVFCKIATEVHGWNIGVCSAEGKGTELWIELIDFDTVDS